MIKVLRIINRFNLGGPTYNATFLSAFLSEEFETCLIGGKHEEHEGESLFIPQKYEVEVKIVDDLQRSLNFSADKKALAEIRQIIRDYKPDIVHTHASKAGALGRQAAYKENVPIIVHTFHGHVFHSYFGRLKTLFYKKVERRLARKTDAIVAISPIQKQELSREHKIADSSKFYVIPLGFDLDKFHTDKEKKRQEFRATYNLSEEQIAIGIIGRLTAIKNHEWFFKAIRQLSLDCEKDIKVFVIGDGELMDELQNLAREIEEEVQKKLFVFTSWIKNVDWALAGLDLVALSSLNEGTPVSLIEAQASGTPIVTTNVGGVKDVVSDGETGFVINDFKLDDYVLKLKDLAEDENLRKKMSQNGWNHVEHKFHYRRLCADMEKLYKELLAKKKRG